MNSNKLCIIVRGLPGSGKTTEAKRLAKKYNAVHLEADDYFMVNGEYKFDRSKLHEAHKDCFNRFKAAINANKNVIVANTFVRFWEFKRYFRYAKEKGYLIHVVECKWHYKSVHDVPEETLERMKRDWDKFFSYVKIYVANEL